MARRKKNDKGLYTMTFMFNGKRQFVRAKDQSELTAKVEQRKQEPEEGKAKYITPSLDDYYIHFTEIRRTEIKESTIRSQKIQYDLIAAVTMGGVRFGSMKMQDITRRDIETARKMLLDAGKTPEHLNNCFAHLNHVFNCAVIDETIEKNPCKALKLLKRENKPISETKHRALSENDLIAFLKASEDRQSYYHNIFKIMALTGMRIGEVGALYITDIDKDFIHVKKTITRDEVGCYYIGDNAKTASGKRDIPLNAELKQVIRDQKEQNRMIFGFDYAGQLFPGLEGGFLREYSVNREINRICKDIGLEKFTCHGFRVTFATRFIEQRPQDYKILQDIMGHKDITMTLNVYTRVMSENKITAMQELKIKTS